MTTTTPPGQVPEALIDLIDAYAETRHRCGRVYNAKTAAARNAVIEALSGVQALSAAPAAKKSALRTYPNPIVPLIKPVSEQEKMRALYLASSNLMAYLGRNGAIHSDGHAADAMMDCLNDLDGGGFDETLFAASPTPTAEQTFITPETGNSASAKGAAITSESGTPPAEQQATCTNSDSWNCKYCNKTKTCAALAHAGQPPAPKAVPEVGNSGFDYKTAADFLNGKTVSDEAVRNFVQASRRAHDEKAALSATLLAMHGVLTSREAEIALLKKALLEAETVPQPAPAPLSAREIELLDSMIDAQLNHAQRCDSIPNRPMAEKQKGWDMERVTLLRKLKATMGGQHA